jgi:hypothetical protein
MVQAMGGKCVCCGYDRTHETIDFHHLDPEVKEIGLANALVNPKSWSKIVAELKKCVAVCANCHREIHAGIMEIPADAASFDPAYEDYKQMEKDLKTAACPVCESSMRPGNKTCSRACAATRTGKFDWSKYDLIELSKTMSNMAIARMVGASDVAVAKRLKKLKAEL